LAEGKENARDGGGGGGCEEEGQREGGMTGERGGEREACGQREGGMPQRRRRRMRGEEWGFGVFISCFFNYLQSVDRE
jgi:hypothetical protein